VGKLRFYEATIPVADISKCTVHSQGDARFRTRIHVHARKKVTAPGVVIPTMGNVLDFYVETNVEQQHCPTELESWNRLAKTNPSRPRKELNSAPNSILRSVLGDEGSKDTRPKDNNGDRSGWEAHHIIPASAQRANSARVSGFRCHIHPNAEINGIWLRGASRADGTNGYKQLSPADQKRLRHSRASTNNYYTRINTIMESTRAANYRCNDRRARQLLRAIDDQLALGEEDIHEP
jgi:hypothetical protein